ncbi:choice-of-anchor D domain-containing protein [Haloferula sp.]|uniref:choice-of-anchor D domain-containing protein n=1 Tax=Haloferula sp. TaxID=2497595 RepID=UPI003C75EB36
MTSGTSSVSFPSAVVGEAGSTESFTIANSGDVPLENLAISIDGAMAGDFILGGDPLPESLAADSSATFTISFVPTTAGERIAELRIESNDADENPFLVALAGTGLAPDIAVESGTGDPLATGGPGLSFGGIPLGSSSTAKTVVIRNEGTAPLRDIAATVTGADSGDFQTDVLSLQDSLLPGETTTLTLTFTPTISIARSATLSITSNDADENPFLIDLTGAGQSPEIDLAEAGGSSLSSGEELDYGAVRAGTSGETITLIVSNEGNYLLGNLSAAVDGAHSAEFPLNASGLPATLAPGESATMTIGFAPVAAGARTATLRIANDDLDENPFIITLTGTGTAPILSLSLDGVGALDFESATVDFGSSRVASEATTRTLTLTNEGTAPLIGIGAQITGATDGDFNLSPATLPTSLDPGESQVFTVSFSPTSSGDRSALLSLVSDDASRNPFPITLNAIGEDPEIAVELTGGVDLQTDISTVPLPDTLVGESTAPVTLTVRNLGNVALGGLSLSLDGPDSSDFALGGVPFPSSIDPGASADFTLTFSPSVVGARSANLVITSDDRDENPFSLLLAASGLAPEITVSPETGSPFVTGTSTIPFGNIALGGSSAPYTVVIRNDGSAPLFGIAASLEGSAPGDFSLQTSALADTLAPGESASLTITSAPSVLGERLAVLRITSNDADENPFLIDLTSTGTAPEIQVSQDAEILVLGGAATDFGSVLVGGPGVGFSFTVSNVGTHPLESLAVNIEGADAPDFQLPATSFPASLDPNESFSFNVTFAPGAIGPRQATLRVASNDADENPFEIPLEGTGTAPIIGLSGPDNTPLTSNGIPFDLGSQRFSTSAEPQTLTVSNIGTAALTGLNLTIAGTHGADFAATVPGESTLAPGQSTTFQLRFTPGAAGDRQAELTVSANETAADSFILPLTGKGTFPKIELAQTDGPSLSEGDTVGFASSPVGDAAAALQFSVTNTGDAPLEVSSITIEGPHSGDFELSLGSFDADLAPGSSSTFTITFTPGAGGNRSASLRIASNVPDGSPLLLGLSGVGQVPILVLSDQATTPLPNGFVYDFGLAPSEDGVEADFSLANDGEAPLANIVATITGPDAAAFALSQQAPDLLLPGDSSPLKIVFSPESAGDKAAILSIASNDPENSPFVLNLIGSAASPSIVSDPVGIEIYETESATLSSTATGSGPLHYQWFATPTGGEEEPVGDPSAELTTGPLSITTSFRLRASNGFGTVFSEPALVTVRQKIPVFVSASELQGAAGTLFQHQVQATLGPLSFSSLDLPEWLALDPASGALIGMPPSGGSWTFSVTAANQLRSATQTIQLVVTPPIPVFTNSRFASGRQGQPFVFFATATNQPESFAASGLPSSIVIDDSTGRISGTPIGSGTFQVNLTATNSGGSGLQTLTIEIDPPLPLPTVTSPKFAAGTAGELFSLEVAASPEAGNYEIRGNPEWLTIDPDGGVITGTPSVPGTFSAEVRASNTSGAGSWTLIEISISPDPQAPKLTHAAEVRGRKGDPFSFTLTANPSASEFFVYGALPQGLVLENSVSGLISGTPDVEGNIEVEIVAENEFGVSLRQKLRFVLGPPREVPIIAGPTSIFANIGQTFSVSITASASPDSFQFGQLPAGLSQEGVTGTISGIPTVAGTYEIPARATNADGTGPEQIVILEVIYPEGSPLIGLLDEQIWYAGLPITFQIPAENGAQEYFATDLPPGVELSPSSGVIGGTPTEAGEYTVTLSATNSSGSGEPVTVAITVLPTPGTPEINGSLLEEAQAGEAFSYATQALSELPILSYSASGLPAGLVFDASTGIISGTPAVAGSFEIALAASNQVGVGQTAMLMLTIRPQDNRPAITSAPSVSIGQGESLNYQITATNGPILAYRSSILPDGLLLDAKSGSLSGRPTYPGIQKVTLAAANAAGTGASLELQIIVRPNPNVPQIIASSSIYYVPDQLFSYPLDAVGLPAQKPWPTGVGIFASSLPPGMSLNSSTGVLSGGPRSEWNHSYADIYASNESGRSATRRIYFFAGSIFNQNAITGPLQISTDSVTNKSIKISTASYYSTYYYSFRILGNYTRGQDSAYFDLPVLSAGRYTYNLFTRFSWRSTWGRVGYYHAYRNGLPLTVSPTPNAPRIQSADILYVTAGEPANLKIQATGSPTYFNFSFYESYPSGLSYQSSTGTFYGTPTRPGTYTIRAQAYRPDTLYGLPKDITLVVAPAAGSPELLDSPPQTAGLLSMSRSSLSSLSVMPTGGSQALMMTASLEGQVGVAFSHTFYGSVGTTRFEIEGLPEGLALNENTGEISGEPTEPGEFELSITPIAGLIRGETSCRILKILPADGTPVVTSSTTADATAESEFSWTFEASESPMVWNIEDLPDWLAFDTLTGTLSGTPRTPGTESFAVSALNALGVGAAQEFSITVVPASGTPVINPPALAGQVGEPFSATLTATGSPVSFDTGALPYGIELDSATGNLSGIPLEAGSHSILIWASNSVGQGDSIEAFFDFQPAEGAPMFEGQQDFQRAAGKDMVIPLSTQPSADTFTAFDLPEGWELEPTTGVIRATPAQGTYRFFVEAWNPIGGSGKTAVIVSIVVPEDSDEDGMSDAFEDLHGFDKDDPTDAELDFDNDGIPNLREEEFGTNPKSLDTISLRVAGQSITDPNPLTVSFVPLVTSERLTYILYYTPTLDDPGTWLEIDRHTENSGGDGTPVEFDHTPSSPEPFGFYRVGFFSDSGE